MNKEQDPRYIRCEEILRESLKKLIVEKKLNDINITNLCKKAGIDRKTFYLHYNNIDDLLFAILNELNNVFIDRIKNLNINNLNILVFEYINFINEEHSFFETIITSESYSYILSRNIKNFFESVHDIYKPIRSINKNKQSLIIAFINNTFFTIYKQWVLDGKKISIDELIILMTDLLNNGIKNYS